MKRKITFLGIMLLAMAVLAGCKGLHKIPYGATRDLMKQDDFTMVEGSKIVDFRIRDRQTDDAAGVDQFELCIDIDHPAATETRVYQMEYIYQDHAWMLNGCQEQPASRQWAPKAEPTQEDIIRVLKTSSDAQIAAAFAEQEITDARSKLRCFGEPYFDANVDPGTRVDDNRYNCFVEVENQFDLAVSKEKMLLKLEFDPDTYTWEYCGDVSLDTQTQWSIAGTWESPDGNMQLKIGHMEESEDLTITCTMDGQTVNTTASLSDLSCKSLNPTTVSVSSMAGKPIFLDLEIGPDRILCFDRIVNGSWDMRAVDVEEPDTQIAGRGFRFVVLSEETIQYKAVADRIIEMMDMQDLKGLLEMTPVEETRERVVLLTEFFNSDQLDLCVPTHCATVYYTESSPDAQIRSLMESAAEVVPDVQAVSCSEYLVETEQNGQSKWYLFKMLIVHGEESDYLLSIE